MSGGHRPRGDHGLRTTCTNPRRESGAQSGQLGRQETQFALSPLAIGVKAVSGYHRQGVRSQQSSGFVHVVGGGDDLVDSAGINVVDAHM